jgi:hypothetical protein
MRVEEIVTKLLDRHDGHKNKAAKAAGVNASEFGKVTRGVRPLGDGMRKKIEAYLSGETPPADAETPTITFDIAGRKRGPNSGRALKDKYEYPPLLAELIRKYDGRHNRAAAAMGYRTATVIVNWAKDHSTFDDLAQLRVQRALRGEPPPSESSEEPDTYKLGLVVGLFPAANFERALDAADAFNGKTIFKASVRTEWLGIWKMQEDKAKLFKKLMGRDAVKITCP